MPANFLQNLFQKGLSNNKSLGAICLMMCLGIFAAGLWPFDFWPENKVEWLKDRNGVHFYGQGIIFSDPEFNTSLQALFHPGPITIEIWLQADSESHPYLPQILSLYDGAGSEEFFVGQWKSHLVLRTKVLRPKSKRPYREIGVTNALPKGQRRLITITTDEKATSVYVDGRLEKAYPDFSFISKDRKISNQIILGNSATGKAHWTGNILGLAIYKRSLDADRVIQHFQNWMNGNPSSTPEEESQAAIYSFYERAGTRIHDPINRHDLLMLPRFKAPQRDILVPPWKDFRLNLSYFSDMMTNILGFIPFGFLLSALIGKRINSGHRRFIIVLLLGFSLSLSIELLQVYLPTRNSQLMDVFTNIMGTALGTIPFHFYQSRTRH